MELFRSYGHLTYKKIRRTTSTICWLLLYVDVSSILHKTVMSFYSDKLTHVQVIINCLYSVAQFCTSKDMLAHILGTPFITCGIQFLQQRFQNQFYVFWQCPQDCQMFMRTSRPFRHGYLQKCHRFPYELGIDVNDVTQS